MGSRRQAPRDPRFPPETSYDEMYDQFKDKGIDDVYCISVNDAFVMNAWARDLGIKNVKMTRVWYEKLEIFGSNQ